MARFVGTFRSISGESEVIFNLKDKTCVGTVIHKIVERFPKLEEMLVFSKEKNGIINALVLLNGREIGVLKNLDTVIEDGDELVLIPVSHGG
ncbi:MAG: MoaD/ThiS family protein [Candidatus Bathyarchaeota archaeon]